MTCELEQTLSDKKWWQDQEPPGWKLHGWTFRSHAMFVRSDGQYQNVSGEFMNAVASSVNDSVLQSATTEREKIAQQIELLALIAYDPPLQKFLTFLTSAIRTGAIT